MTTTEIEWSPAVDVGTTIWVTEYFRTASNPVPVENDLGYEVRVTKGTKDQEGDIELVDNGASPRNYAHKWRLPITEGLPAEEQRPPAGVIWNPEVKKGDIVWVYRDSSMEHLQPDMHRGFDVRTVQYEVKDSDGEITLDPSADSIYIYARKWRHPEQNLQPAVNEGDKVKVLGVLEGAADSYREAVLGKVLTVVRGKVGFQGELTVKLPDGYTSNDLDTGAIAQWALIESLHRGEPEPQPEQSKDWADIIARWRHELTEYACREGWCSEYEEVVENLFGWKPERGGDFSVTVRLTRERWLSDLTSNICYQVFDGERDEDMWDLDDERIDVRANTTITITCKGKEPTDDEVKEYLNDQDFEFDEFEIVDWNLIED